MVHTEYQKNYLSGNIKRMVVYSKVVFFKTGSWSGVIHLAGDALNTSMCRLSSASCLEMPLARQTTPDHLPIGITFLALGGRAKDKKKHSDSRLWLWLYFYLLMLLFYLE